MRHSLHPLVTPPVQEAGGGTFVHHIAQIRTVVSVLSRIPVLLS
jgi:hypothetical protein